MKAKILLPLVALLAIACSKPDQSNIRVKDCSEPLDFEAIYSEYSAHKKPLADIDFDKPLNPSWMKADFQILRRILEEANPNLYRYAGPSKMDSLFQKTLCQLKDSLSYRDFTKQIAQLFNTMACGHSGWLHSKEYRRYRKKSMRFFPLEILSIKDRYYIVKNNSRDTTISLGTEILAINNQDPAAINQQLRKYMYKDGTSLPEAETEISKYFPNAYSNFIAEPEVFRLKLKDSNGAYQQVEIPALAKSEIDSISQSRYAPAKQMGKPLVLELDSTKSIARYRIKWFRKEYIESRGQDFNAFTDSVFQLLESNAIEHLIIDLRGNVGGWTAYGKRLFSYFIDEPMPYINKVELSSLDSFSFQPLMLSDQGLSDTMQFHRNADNRYEWENYPNLMAYPATNNHFIGQVYILSDEESRSCSAVFAALMKSHTEALFIGEECGAAQCGSGGMVMAVMLPFTGITIFTSTAKYSSNVSDPENSRGLKVDYRIKPSLQDYLNNHDSQLEFTYKLIEKG